MLVLARKKNQRIILPDVHVEITVLSIQPDLVKIGIVAPRELAVHREEVWLKIVREKLNEKQDKEERP